MKSLSLAATLLLAASSTFALPAKFLAPDNTGRPQIQITSSGQYYLFRAADAYDGACVRPGIRQSLMPIANRGAEHWRCIRKMPL